MDPVTVGLDIGTTSIKAAAVDAQGAVLSRVRLPHPLHIPAPDRMEHDADRAWRRGPRRALAALKQFDPVAVAVASMVPSMTAVDKRGRPCTPGLLYGDARGRGDDAGGEVGGFLRWTVGQAPDASGYWLAQSVANRALGGAPAIDLAVALTCGPLYGPAGWDPGLLADIGIKPDQMPVAEIPGAPVGKVDGDGPLLTAGSVDVWCEQLVAGADQVGDVLLICGTTLIIWAVTPADHPVPAGLWTVPQPSGGGQLIGGASNAGGLFLDWVKRAFPLRRPDILQPDNVPIWTPYPRGERTPYHDPDRRAGLHELNLSHGSAAIQRAAYEASGFVVRHHLDLAAATPRRIVVTGGGTRVDDWMQALADVTGQPVHVAATPEGAARGAAFLARMAAGLETDYTQAAAWAVNNRVIDPDPRWVQATNQRYQRFRELTGRVA
jgi:xylulokinase